MISQYVPRKWALALSWPVFVLVELDSRGEEEYDLSYMGDGEFELVGKANERSLGRGEAFISMLPTIIYLVPFMLVLTVEATSYASLLALVVTALLPLIALGTLNEVSVIHAGDSA